VVEVAEEMVKEELPGDAVLATGLAGWGNNPSSPRP
jgi:hypothetical protein